MIELTRLNGHPVVLNSDLIKLAESSPDTMLTLSNGEKIIVRESCEQVVEKVLAWRAKLLAEVAKFAPGSLAFLSSSSGGTLQRKSLDELTRGNHDEIEIDSDVVQRRRKDE
jgi:flagellar protein FlbD